MTAVQRGVLASLVVLVVLMACAPASDGTTGGTGGTGSVGTGGRAAVAAAGGAGTGGAGSGGASGGGVGSIGSGGTSTVSSGGSVGTGGLVGSGGAAGTGGSTNAGGVAGTGGATSAGGATGTGGATSVGGTGGAPGTGGLVGSGGVTGGAGRGGAGGTSGCAASGLYICEDFETATVGSKTVAGWTSTGSVQVASDQAHRGTRSLKIGAALTGERTIRRATNMAGMPISATHWGRVFYRIETPAPLPADFVHSTHVFGDGMVSAGRVQVRVLDTITHNTGLHKFGYNVQESYGSNAEHGLFTNPDWKYENIWKCAEWQLDATAKSFHFYLDGVEIKAIGFANATAYGRDPEIPATFTSMGFGWNNYQTSTAPGFVAWFDDIAVGPNRIGCQ